ncbi:ABC-2 type transport system permease protein [Sanguibacter gelidistatuariae]|uniref:Transport permease protein n=1 Tax=Sanguibacter gelidistatuariae TaxID=1814289 RepID=A0A1G6K7Y3_9MICO|nr:ABC transporter permease [Sanguibacter gelidistatuariae]SDC27159.1 ABC-2 type transport system permease protein [Sanguibacter gelidistatuariae]
MSTQATRTTQPSPGRPLPGALRLSVERARVEMTMFFRERDAVIFIFAYPIIMLAIFATVFGQDGAMVDGDAAGAGAIPFAQYFLPGMVATGVMLTSFQSLAISIAVERDEGSLKRLRATPLPPVSYFAGKIFQTLLVSGVQIALLLAVGSVMFGIDLPTSSTAWLTFAWVFLLGTATGTVCGIGFSSLPRSGKSASAVVTPVVLVLQFVSGVFFVFTDLPTWMQKVAEVFPLKWMAQGMRSVFLPPEAAAWEASGSWQHGATAFILGAWLIAGLVVGVRTFRWRRRDDG